MTQAISTAALARGRRLSALLCRLQGSAIGARMVKAARTAPVLGPRLRRAVQFRAPFPDAAAARAAAKGLAALDQDCAENVALHLHLAQTARPSDAPAIAALRDEVAAPLTIVDLGGNAGNLFYLYRQSLNLHPDLRWIVHDLPGICTAGAQRAAEQGATQLGFDPDPGVIARADILLCSGVLQYFEAPLGALLDQHRARPRLVIANRTPLARAARVYTVQDAGDFFALCVLHNRAELLDGMVGLGYRLAAEWPAPDLRLDLPLWPEQSVAAYSGFVWRRN